MPLHDHHEILMDEDLLCKVREGRRDCFALLFHRYCGQVFSVAFRILRDRSALRVLRLSSVLAFMALIPNRLAP